MKNSKTVREQQRTAQAKRTERLRYLGLVRCCVWVKPNTRESMKEQSKLEKAEVGA